MKSKDLNQRRTDVRQMMANAIKDGDENAYAQAFEQLCQVVGDGIREEYDQRLDSAALSARGVYQLTKEEKTYYQKLGEAMKSNDPKQALVNADLVMPETVINKVFEDLATNHPLLSKINFIYTGGAVKMMLNEDGYQCAAWGKLTDEIVKELTSGFKEVDTTLCKLTAFLPVAKAMLDLGPQWLDRYVREVLYEAFANGLEVGIVDGTGKDQPIGMTRDVSDDVAVVDGVYPQKVAVALTRIDATSIGALLARVAVSPNGKARPVQNVLFLVNPADYFSKVMPATTIMGPDGTYRNNVMPYPMDIIQTPAVPANKAVIGLGKRYAAMAGTAVNGKIEFSDHYRFVEDERMYICKGYANGMPMDDNAFIVLDITDLEALLYQLVQVTAAEAEEV